MALQCRITAMMALVAVVLLSMGQCVDAAAKLRTLRGLPLLQCSACEVMALEMGRRMNITKLNNKGHSVLKSSRRTEDRRVDYESSQLRAVEVLDMLCPDLKKKARFVRTTANVRLYTLKPGDLPVGQIYTKKELAVLSGPMSKLEKICEEIIDGYEDLLTRVMRKKRTTAAVFSGMCEYGMKLCGKDEVKEFMQLEVAKFEKWEKTKASGGWVPQPVVLPQDFAQKQLEEEEDETLKGAGEL